jgi:nitrogen regulation protein NR(I)
MTHRANILLVEDDASAASSLQTVLEDEGHVITPVMNGREGLRMAVEGKFDLVLSDWRLPGISGLDLVRQLHAAKPKLPIILMTAHGTTDTAIEATKNGAYDYLLKPFEMPELIELVHKALDSSRLSEGEVELGRVVAGRTAIIGNSRAMQVIYKELGRIAARPVSVLIRGETGTGKELIARAIVQYSDRADGPFIAVNCAAIPETLLESELFGHEKGAFTGADARRIGRFEQANGGTIFLDEIGDMPINTQAKLLRVLQERAIQRVGGKETIPVEVRLVAATHRDLDQAIAAKEFREDLFYRLNVVVIDLPSLRQRSEDIPDLVRYFLKRYGEELGASEPTIQPDALEFLSRQPWPGNVRELENTVRKVLLAARGFTITLAQVQEVCRGARSLPASGAGATLAALADDLLQSASRGERENVYDALVEMAERELLRRAMEIAHGNQARAARWLGISRLTLRDKLHKLGLHPAQQAGE